MVYAAEGRSRSVVHPPSSAPPGRVRPGRFGLLTIATQSCGPLEESSGSPMVLQGRNEESECKAPPGRRSLSGLGMGVVQQTAFSCCPIKHCSHMLFAASLRLLQSPCPARQPIQQSSTAASESCSLSSSLPRCHGDTRHLRAVRRLGNGGASAAPPGDSPLLLQPHSRALLVDGRGSPKTDALRVPVSTPSPLRTLL